MDYGDEQLSEFNSNFASLMRIDNDIKKAKQYYEDENWTELFKKLRSLRVEARYKMKHKIKDDKCIKDCPRCKCDLLFNGLNKLYFLYLSKKEDKIRNNFANDLDKFFLFLTDFMGGKGMLLRDAPDEASTALK